MLTGRHSFEVKRKKQENIISTKFIYLLQIVDLFCFFLLELQPLFENERKTKFLNTVAPDKRNKKKIDFQQSIKRNRNQNQFDLFRKMFSYLSVREISGRNSEEERKQRWPSKRMGGLCTVCQLLIFSHHQCDFAALIHRADWLNTENDDYDHDTKLIFKFTVCETTEFRGRNVRKRDKKWQNWVFFGRTKTQMETPKQRMQT